jgi:pyruvate decarboxylase
VRWIGNCNELNAGYAADGYARIRGLGALCTTYGVGELSAINAVAGSYAERVSVMNIVGTPSRRAQSAWDEDRGTGGYGLMHHMLGIGEPSSVFKKMHEPATVGLCDLIDQTKATAMFDDAVRTCLVHRRPVHVSLPSDMAGVEVDGGRLEEPIEVGDHSTPESLEEAGEVLIKKLTSAQRPLVLVDGVSDRYQLRQEINQLISRTGIPALCLPHGLGIVENDLQSYYGVYTGKLSSQELKEYVGTSDLTMLFYPILSDTGTAGWSAVPNMKDVVWMSPGLVRYQGRRWQVNAKVLLTKLLESPELETLKTKKYTSLPKQYPAASAATIPIAQSPVTQDYLWPRLSSFFQSGDTILLANGTPLIGAKLFELPPKVRVIASGLWFSVGHMLPAAQGAALGMQGKERGADWSGRTILLEGDGSFQATAQELSTIIRYKLDCTIFIANNEGYAYERLIEGPKDDYNDVAGWNYTLATEMMGAVSTEEYPVQAFKVEDVGEMEAVLKNELVQRGKGLTLVDVKMGREDVPEYFRDALSIAGKRLRGL